MNKFFAQTLSTSFMTLALATPLQAAHSPREVPAKNHCVATLEHVIPGVPDARISQYDCYSSFSEAIYAATDGMVWLPSNESFAAQRQVLDQELKALKANPTPSGPYVISVDYMDVNYAGFSLTFRGDAPCSTTVAYETTGMPSGWNDVTSSSIGHSNCNTNIQYEHVYYGGAVVVCTPDCVGFGSLNDRISSRRWFN